VELTRGGRPLRLVLDIDGNRLEFTVGVPAEQVEALGEGLGEASSRSSIFLAHRLPGR
jgi:hypothetical protein